MDVKENLAAMEGLLEGILEKLTKNGTESVKIVHLNVMIGEACIYEFAEQLKKYPTSSYPIGSYTAEAEKYQSLKISIYAASSIHSCRDSCLQSSFEAVKIVEFLSS